MASLNFKPRQELKTITSLTNLIVLLVLLFPLAISVLGSIFGTNAPLVAIINFFDALVVYSITLWLFLGNPDTLIKKYHLQPLLKIDSGKYELLQGWIRQYTTRKIHLLVSTDNQMDEFEAFGTWRHNYIAISSWALENLDSEELQYAFLHELSHLIFGDHWKIVFARYLMLSSVSYVLFGSINTVIHSVWLFNFDLSFFMPILSILLGLFPSAVIGIGVLYIKRLREVSADTFALQQTTIRAAKRFFAKLSVHQYGSGKQNRGATILMPQLFRLYPKVRWNFINKFPALLKSETEKLIQATLIFSGLILGTLAGRIGDIAYLVFISFPLILSIGPILLIYITDILDNKKIQILATYIFVLTGIAALVSSSLTLAWVLVTGDQYSSFSAASWTRMTYAFPLILDNHILLLSIVSFLLLVFLALTIKLSALISKIFPKLSNVFIATGWSIWIPLCLGFSVFWIKLFFPYIKYAMLIR